MSTTVAANLISLADKERAADRMEGALSLILSATAIAKTERLLVEMWINEMEKTRGITTVYSTLEIIEQALIELGAKESLRNAKSGLGGPTQ